MIHWLTYSVTAITTLTLWYIGIIFLYLKIKGKSVEKTGTALILAGILIFILFIANYWLKLERAPLRTLGETRLWYSLFLSLIGITIYLRWKLKWMVPYSIFISTVFVLINLYKPEYFDKTLMPALQSYWFVPHVIVYIFAYSLLGAATLFSVKGLFQLRKNTFQIDTLNIADNIVYLGFAFLTFGLLFGALWAKEAWGSYWTWDPKETWAFITWMLYLLYIHYRYFHRNVVKTPLWLLSLAFVILMICWFGINYLPSAQTSVHVYSN